MDAEQEEETVSGVFSMDLAGPEKQGVRGGFSLKSDRAEIIEYLYPEAHSFVGPIPDIFGDMFDMLRLDAAVVDGIDIHWPEDDRLEFRLLLDDEAPRFLEIGDNYEVLDNNRKQKPGRSDSQCRCIPSERTEK